MNKKKIYGRYPEDEEKFAGEYISVVDNKIIAHGKEPDKVIKIAKQFDKEPLLIKVPEGGWREETILWMRLHLREKK